MALHDDVATLGGPHMEAACPSFDANGASHIGTVPTPVHRYGEAAYEALRWGLNIVLEHHPAAIVEATSETDIVMAIELATREGCPVAVMNTGHGPTVAADGAVLVRTGRMNRVEVDPVQRTPGSRSSKPSMTRKTCSG
jgi:FAD/FMN-containing dehydrogenase